jgi:hypothetical protein
VRSWRTGINQPQLEKEDRKMTLGFSSSILFGEISSACPACVEKLDEKDKQTNILEREERKMTFGFPYSTLFGRSKLHF